MGPVSACELLRLRLATQRLAPQAIADVADTVRHMLAVQAQDFAQALWAVGVRSPNSTRTSVLETLASGAVVRTLPMRGTLHFTAAEDLRWMLSLTAERTLQSLRTRLRVLELDQATLDRAERVTRDALAGGNSLDRAGFMRLLERNGIAPDGQRGYHVILYLTQLRLICWGPPSGTQQALVLVEEWIPPTPELDRAEALETFALRYFASHGPATERDFAWWTKLPLRDVRAAIAGLGDRLVNLSNAGVEYFIAASEFERLAASTLGSTVLALPGFDEYLLGYQDRSLALETEHFQRIVPGNNGIFLPMIVSKGEIVGTWRRNATTKGIDPEHFIEATAGRRASFGKVAARYAAFMNG